ncbi:TIGR02452 family protein [Candidatus Thiothrix sp. Deng01]|uniref:TIGR02452 family protein n=1 Tax=Candidatus Thiothrix phosphatis TaxID=3112415 RepID=A0ABU6CZ89_9GAMM|nr:TIGR02452 family protein [Candidatus Thiothrix sp. Deng01]MEB4591382.1 TIGR02452 family protein [Candidatus Thiothrix sp. Deng01]
MMEQLAEELGDLSYDSLADFLHLLGEKILRASNTHMQNNHPELAGHLMACSKHLEQASSEVLRAWQTSPSHNHTITHNNRATTMNQNSRLQRTQIADDTLAILQQGYYQANVTDKISIQPQLEACVQNTRLYTPETLANLPNPTVIHHTVIEVINETTLQGAKRLYDNRKSSRIAVLNFASAKNAGGGFLGGSQAQEESLARSSGLYASLQHCPAYYDYHRQQSRTLLYSDHMIYSPACPVFKQDDGAVLPELYYVDFITSAAPNRGAIARNEPQSLEHIESVFAQRIRYVLQLAAHQGCDALVLGAWGCGVFGNLPTQVANLFACELTGDGMFAQAFRHISFSIPANPKALENILAFRQAFTTGN